MKPTIGTAFIVDFRNSTRLYKYNPKARILLPIMLKEIFEQSAKIINSVESSNENVHFNDTGDGFICGFLGEADLIKALYCASRIRNMLYSIRKKYNKKLGTTIFTGLDYGIGLYRGYVTKVEYHYITIGGEPVHKKTLIGNACNIASRIEDYSKFQKYYSKDMKNYTKFKGCRLITTESTLEKLDSIIDIDDKLLVYKKLGFLEVRGIDKKIKIVALKSGIHKTLKPFLQDSLTQPDEIQPSTNKYKHELFNKK